MGPRPLVTGPFAVGVTRPDFESQWIESHSTERQHVSGSPIRPFVQVWYPADPDARAAGNAGHGWRALRRVAGNRRDIAARDLPFAAGSARYPLLIYFPGWPGTQIENYGLINELASHGFIVAGVVYPARGPNLSPAAFHRQVTALEQPMDYSSEAAYRRTQAEGTARVRARSSDAVTLLDVMARVDGARATPLARRVDLDRIGIVGFSLGGAVAAQASTLDPRFAAVVNIDGRHWDRALERGVSQPYLFIGEELRMPTEADLAATDPNRRYHAIEDQRDYSQLALNLRRHGGMQVVVPGARHAHFTDGGGQSRLRRLTHAGERSAARRVLEILHAYVPAFFRRILKSEPAPLLLSGARPFAHAHLQVWEP